MPQVLDNAAELRSLLAQLDNDSQVYLRNSLRRSLMSAYNEGMKLATEAAMPGASRHAVFQDVRYRALLAQIKATLDVWNKDAAAGTRTMLRNGIDAAHKVMNAQIQSIAARGEVAIPWNPMPIDAFVNMSSFTSAGSPLDQIFQAANAGGADRAGQALRTGVLLGRSSSRVGADLQHALGIPAWRGHLIARTELHRVARETQRGMMAANAHLYEGWQWRASLDSTTCAICWSLHGTFFPATYGSGVDDWHGAVNASAIPQPPVAWAAKPRIPSMISHPNCRCAMVPRPRSFAEILGDPTIPDARPPLPPMVNGKSAGEAAFAGLPRAKQLEILGPQRYKMYQADPNLKQFLYVRPNRVWGNTLALRPLCI
jgi:hypothetical protein